MPHHERAAVTGRITDVFAHRFVIATADGRRVLADLGPKGAALFTLEPGLEVTAEGEERPSELKVDRIAAGGRTPVAIPHKPKAHHGPGHRPKRDAGHSADATSEAALEAVRSAGHETLGAPRRKPKHFEVLTRNGRAFVECHVDFDGHIRKQKPVAPHDEKWSDAIEAA